MIYITAAAIAALALVTIAALHTVGQMLRAHARERNLMLNQLLYLAGRTWEPPPAETPYIEPEPEEERYTMTPSQMPDWADE